MQPDDDYGTLHERLSRLGAEMLVQVLDEFERGAPPKALPQDEAQVTKAPKLFADDFVLDWSQTASELRNRVRALSPNPGALAKGENIKLKILKADTQPAKVTLKIGQISLIDKDLCVGTGDGILRLNVVQPEGRRPMPVSEYLRGRPKLPQRFD